jgi:hypothetical protein
MSLTNETLASLVRPDSVHKRVYTDPQIFELEMQRIYGRAWIYVGHESQVKNPGDYHTTLLGDQDVVMVRAGDARFTSSTTAARTRARRSSPTAMARPASSFAARITRGPSGWMARTCRRR